MLKKISLVNSESIENKIEIQIKFLKLSCYILKVFIQSLVPVIYIYKTFLDTLTSIPVKISRNVMVFMMLWDLWYFEFYEFPKLSGNKKRRLIFNAIKL